MPHCGIKLGNFLYADACPFCHEELKHNTRPLVSATKKDSQKPKSWPVRLFFSHRAICGKLNQNGFNEQTETHLPDHYSIGQTSLAPSQIHRRCRQAKTTV